MCGITGFISFNEQFSESDLHQITNPLKHRGPNAKGYFFDNTCGLGHRRLSILDLSDRANQPMYSQNKRYVMVFNGEVYDFQEIAKTLAIQLKTTSDTEVVLESFAQKYVNFLHDLNGMFALAIYDTFEQSLYLFRDRIGIKPLYYYFDETYPDRLVFASELKSITELSTIPKEVNLEAVKDFLHLGYIPNPKSIYKNIHKLPAGSWLKLSQKEGVVIEKYWDLRKKIYDAPTQKKLNILNKEEEAEKQLKKLLHKSLEYRLISDVPLGVFLSGGIDSSTVAAVASKELSLPINTFSIGFEENTFNEATYAKEVAKHIQSNHYELYVSIQDAKKLIPELINFYDEPFADASAVPTFIVSKFAKERVTVALGGDGGDELFFGYGMYLWAKRLQKSFWKGMRKPTATMLKMLKGNKYQKASHLFRYPNKQEIAHHIFSQEQHYFGRLEIENLMTNAPQTSYSRLVNFPRELTAMEKQAFFDLEFYLPDDLLVKVDRASMQNSLEVRVPMLDHRIIEFALNLNPELKYKKGESKYLLKKILYQYLPKKLFDRPKRGFSIPLIEWLQGDLSFLIDEYLNEEVIKRFGIIKYEEVVKYKEKFKKGRTYIYGRLWALIVLHQFLVKNFA